MQSVKHFSLVVTASILALLLHSCSLFQGTDAQSADTVSADSTDVQFADGAPVDTGAVQQPPRRLPTLREQMRSIEERQAAMQTDIQAIRTDLADVKSDLADLRRLVQDSPFVTQSPNATGDKPSAIEQDPETFLLPDEATTQLATGDVNSATADSKSGEDDVVILQPDPPKKTRQSKKSVNSGADALNEPKSLAQEFNPDRRIVNPPVFPQRYYDGLDHIRRRNYLQAADSLLLVLDDNDDPFVRAKTFRWLGEAYYGAGQWQESINFFLEFLNSGSYPDEVQAVLILLGNAHVKLGDTDQARKYFQQLVDTYPDGELVARARRMLQIL